MQGTERHFALLIDKQIFQRVLRAAFGATDAGRADPFGIARKSIWFLSFRVSRGDQKFFSTLLNRVLPA
ncbi:hypothetical protein D9M70_607540 [compost metagenome]